MTGNTFGNAFKVTTFGESHGPALGCVIDGCPAGIRISEKEIQKELDRRRPGQSKITTARKEGDKVEILSGVFEGVTTGTPIALLIRNQDQKSRDYSQIKNIFRPGHADFTWLAKFGLRDYRGGGRSSGRETAARVAAGAIAQKVLDSKKIQVTAFTEAVGGIWGSKIDLKVIEKNPVRAADAKAAKEMEIAILAAKAAGDSLGGVIRLLVQGAPAGLGEPVFDKASAVLGHALLSIGTVKGIEFGAGFTAAALHGSENNDEFLSLKKKATNHAGGLLGGITDGSEISIRLALKPAASISQTQQTVDLKGKVQKIQIQGRHDPCILPRAVPVVEAMARIALADLLLLARGNRI
jgi:chorismate synthase